jgi:hypothetical protein
MKIHCGGRLQLKNDGVFDVLFVIYDTWRATPLWAGSPATLPGTLSLSRGSSATFAAKIACCAGQHSFSKEKVPA